MRVCTTAQEQQLGHAGVHGANLHYAATALTCVYDTNTSQPQAQHMYQAIVRGNAPRAGGASDPFSRNTCSAVK